MVRRRRLLVVLLLVLVGVPFIAAVILAVYIRSGGLQNEISAGWTRYGMPGRLQVRAFRVEGLQTWVAEGLSLGEDGQPPIATAERAVIRFDIIGQRLVSLRIEGAHGGLDEARFHFLEAILKAEEQHHPTRAPQTVTVDVAGDLTVPGGLQVADVVVHVEALGAAATVTATGSIAGRPLELAISTSRVRPDAPVVTHVEVKSGKVDARQAIAAVVGIGLVKAPPDEALPFLPGVVDVTGSVVSRDPVADTFAGPVKGTWMGGGFTADLDADHRKVVLDRCVLRDERLGSAHGRIEALRHGEGVAVDATAWQAGPAVPLPPKLPLAEIAGLLPGLQVRWPVGAGRTAITLSGASNARLEVQLGGGLPPRVQAAELPLTLIQSLIPPPLLIGGGDATALTATLAEGRPDVALEVRQARFLAAGWAFGPIDGHIAAVVGPDGGVTVSADLPIGSQAPDHPTRIAFAGSGHDGSLAIECQAIEGLIARLRGPALLPDLSGRLVLQTAFKLDGGSAAFEVQRLELGGAELRLKGRDFAKAIDAVLKGRVTVSSELVGVDLGGQLRSGQLLIPVGWLALAARTPIFSLDLQAHLRAGRLEGLELRNAMIRAANAKGEPQPGGFSAQFGGRLDGERLGGHVDGVIDHGDLGWIVDKLAPGDIQVVGEGAVAASATIDNGEVQRIDGNFLPLDADLDVDHSRLKVGGITGNVHFTIDAKGVR